MKEKYIILSVIGMSAGERIERILKRKIDDTDKVGFTFWVYKSNQASPKTVQDFCKKAKTENKKVFVFLLSCQLPMVQDQLKLNFQQKNFLLTMKSGKNYPKNLVPLLER